MKDRTNSNEPSMPFIANSHSTETTYYGLSKLEHASIEIMKGMTQSVNFLNISDYKKEETPDIYVTRKCKEAIYIAKELLKHLEDER